MKTSRLLSLLRVPAAVFLLAHGAVHVMAFLSYWQLAEFPELGPYTATLLGGRWFVGDAGIRLVGLVWLVPVAGYPVAVYGLLRWRRWWPRAMMAVTVVSLAVCLLDFRAAYRGVYIDTAILVLTLPVLLARSGARPDEKGAKPQ